MISFRYSKWIRKVIWDFQSHRLQNTGYSEKLKKKPFFPYKNGSF